LCGFGNQHHGPKQTTHHLDMESGMDLESHSVLYLVRCYMTDYFSKILPR
jgi:hypothetical protein